MGVTLRTKAGKEIRTSCDRCGRDGELGRIRFVNGVEQAAYFCTYCGVRFADFVPKAELQRVRISVEDLKLLQDNTATPEVPPMEHRSIWNSRPDCNQCGTPCSVYKVSRNAEYLYTWACPICGTDAGLVDPELAGLDGRLLADRPLLVSHQRHLADYQQEYLTSSWWARVSWATKWVAGGRCALCGKVAHFTGMDWLGLRAHHNTYDRRGTEAPGDMICICEDCHAKFHDKLPEAS